MPKLLKTIAPFLWAVGFLAYPGYLLIRFAIDPGMFPTLFSGGRCVMLIIFATIEEWFRYHAHMLMYHLLVYFLGTLLVMMCISGLVYSRLQPPLGKNSHPIIVTLLLGVLGVTLLVVGYWFIYPGAWMCVGTLLAFFNWGGGVGLWVPFALMLVIWVRVFRKSLAFIRHLPR